MASVAWKFAPWLGCLVLGWLLLQAHEDIGAAVAECNADKLLEVAQAENAVRVTLQRTHAAELAARDRQLEIQAEARKTAEAARLQALQGVETRDVRIRQLELEVWNAETLPDSREALNVFVPSDVVERMWWDENCTETGDSGDSGNEVCTDSSGVLDDNAPNFASLTFGDALFAWNHDRKSLRECNIDKRAIGAINEKAQPD